MGVLRVDFVVFAFNYVLTICNFDTLAKQVTQQDKDHIHIVLWQIIYLPLDALYCH